MLRLRSQVCKLMQRSVEDVNATSNKYPYEVAPVINTLSFHETLQEVEVVKRIFKKECQSVCQLIIGSLHCSRRSRGKALGGLL